MSVDLCSIIVSIYFQEVLPSTIISTVKELFVPKEELEDIKKEAENLPSLNLSKVRKQYG